MDGVLVDNSEYHLKAWKAFAAEYGCNLTEDDIRRRLGFTNKEYMRFVLGREPTEREVLDATVRKEALYREVYGAHIAPPPGLVDLLNAFRRRGVQCGVATSAPVENVDFVLDGIDIREYFRIVVDSSHVKHGKPDPEVYLLAAERLGSATSDCVVFEDAIAGVQAGKAAGMKVIAITSSYPAEVLRGHSPDAIIGSFRDLAHPCAALDVLRSVLGDEFSVP